MIGAIASLCNAPYAMLQGFTVTNSRGLTGDRISPGGGRGARQRKVVVSGAPHSGDHLRLRMADLKEGLSLALSICRNIILRGMSRTEELQGGQ